MGADWANSIVKRPARRSRLKCWQNRTSTSGWACLLQTILEYTQSSLRNEISTELSLLAIASVGSWSSLQCRPFLIVLCMVFGTWHSFSQTASAFSTHVHLSSRTFCLRFTTTDTP